MSETVPSASTALSELLRVRENLIKQAVALDTERAKVLKQVRVLEASLRVLSPGIELQRERRRQPWRPAETDPNALQEIGKSVLRTLRLKRAPMTVPDIVASLMKERGIEADDCVHRTALRERVGLYLRKQALKERGIVRRVAGSDERMPEWEIVPLEEVRSVLVKY